MIKKSATRAVGLFLTLAVVFTVCGWRPFQAPVTILTTPEGASVYAEDGAKLLGTTPYKTYIFHADKHFVVKKEGFFDEKVTLSFKSMEYARVELKRRPVITLTTTPADVKIYENGTLFTIAPMTKEFINARTFELRKEGYYNKTVELSAASDPQTTVQLTPLPVITIKATPATAAICMVGKSEALGEGSVSLTIEQKTGFEVKADRYYSKTINLEAKTQTANVTLEAMPYVTIASEPAGANVTIAEKSIGTTPVERLVEKATTVTLSLDGYITQTVTLNSSDLNPVITLEKVPPPPEPEPEPVETNATPAAL